MQLIPRQASGLAPARAVVVRGRGGPDPRSPVVSGHGHGGWGRPKTQEDGSKMAYMCMPPVCLILSLGKGWRTGCCFQNRGGGRSSKNGFHMNPNRPGRSCFTGHKSFSSLRKASDWQMSKSSTAVSASTFFKLTVNEHFGTETMSGRCQEGVSPITRKFFSNLLGLEEHAGKARGSPITVQLRPPRSRDRHERRRWTIDVDPPLPVGVA